MRLLSKILRHGWCTIHKLLNVWVIWVGTTYVGVSVGLMRPIWHPVGRPSLLLLRSSWSLGWCSSTSVLLLHIVNSWLIDRLTGLGMVLLMLSYTGPRLLLVECLVHHLKLGVYLFDLILAEKSFLLMNLFIDILSI